MTFRGYRSEPPTTLLLADARRPSIGLYVVLRDFVEKFSIQLYSNIKAGISSIL